jgi:phosphatidylserine/phosphatidylglycerophosphate/cardiolipin synthase-like enzyme
MTGSAHTRAFGASGQVSLVVMPDQGVAPILAGIQGAKKSIWLEMYMFTTNGAPAQLLQALTDKAKAGVDVRVMLDPHPYTTTPGDVNAAAAQALQAGGVKVQNSAPRFKYTHEKGMVIDGQTAYIMTCNFTNSAFTSNREYAVIDTNPTDVSEVGAIFQADWNQQPFTPQDPNLVVSPDNSRQRLLNLIDSAQRSIVLEDEETGDPEVTSHLGARAKAGVSIQVMIAKSKGAATETQQLNAAGVSNVETVSSLNLHAKTIIVDQTRAYVGSENMSANSLDNNRELGIIVQDPAVISGLSAACAKDWANH